MIIEAVGGLPLEHKGARFMGETVVQHLFGLGRVRSDHELVSLILAGDSRAQELFVRQHQERLRRTCVHFLGYQDPDCEDLVQETFLKAFKNLSQWRPEREIYSWLNKICVNLCFKRIRQRQRQQVMAADDLEAAATSLAMSQQRQLEAKDAKREALDLVRLAFGRLEEGCRQIVGLRDFDGKSYADISRALRLAPGTVFSRLARCRNALRRLVLQGTETKGEYRG